MWKAYVKQLFVWILISRYTLCLHLRIFIDKNFIPWKWTNFYIILPRYWTLSEAYQKHLESYEMWYWRRTEKISWTDSVRNEEVW